MLIPQETTRFRRDLKRTRRRGKDSEKIKDVIKEVQKGAAIRIVQVDVLAGVTSCGEMIHRTGKFDA